jgi:hypothetical protein
MSSSVNALYYFFFKSIATSVPASALLKSMEPFSTNAGDPKPYQWQTMIHSYHIHIHTQQEVAFPAKQLSES